MPGIVPAQSIIAQATNALNIARSLLLVTAAVLLNRLAPLSEGRIHGGNLACNYHGWEFDRKGACLVNPQVPGKPSMLPIAYSLLEPPAEHNKPFRPMLLSRAQLHPTTCMGGVVPAGPACMMLQAMLYAQILRVHHISTASASLLPLPALLGHLTNRRHAGCVHAKPLPCSRATCHLTFTLQDLSPCCCSVTLSYAQCTGR